MSTLGDYALAGAGGALVLSLGANWWLYHQLSACEVARERDTGAVAAAQPAAVAAQVAANHAPAAASAKIAKESDHAGAQLYQEGYRAGDAYARAHLVPATSGGAPSGPGVPGTDRPVASNDRSGAADGMVAVSRADFDTCTYYGARLDKVHEDAWKLIAAGAATTSEEFAR